MKCYKNNIFGFRKRCIKDKCIKWVKLFGPDENDNAKRVEKGNCSEYWKVIVETEKVGAINNLVLALKEKK